MHIHELICICILNTQKNQTENLQWKQNSSMKNMMWWRKMEEDRRRGRGESGRRLGWEGSIILRKNFFYILQTHTSLIYRWNIMFCIKQIAEPMRFEISLPVRMTVIKLAYNFWKEVHTGSSQLVLSSLKSFQIETQNMENIV